MPAYVINDMVVTDPELFERYKQLSPPTVARYGGRFLARGGQIENLEGDWSPRRVVIIEVPSLEVDAFCRSSLAGAYSGESHQARARSRLGNSMITTRRGDQSPSRFSICPPRARNRPPYCATVGGESCLERSNNSGSVTTMSLMT